MPEIIIEPSSPCLISPQSQYKVHRKLGESKHPVYLISISDKFFAMKIFSFDSPLFSRETRVTSLSHPSLATPTLTIQEAKSLPGASQNPQVTKFYSLTFSEYCPNGDLHSLIIDRRMRLSEVVARTYFR
jgi:hypothetical protein